MNAFLESAWPALGLGLLALALLGVAWHNTRHRRLPHAMLGVVVAMLLLLLVQWLVVTDREAVANSLEEMAQALESNDLNRVMAHLAPKGNAFAPMPGAIFPTSRSATPTSAGIFRSRSTVSPVPPARGPHSQAASLP